MAVACDSHAVEAVETNRHCRSRCAGTAVLLHTNIQTYVYRYIRRDVYVDEDRYAWDR